jgi:hypothetical protein
MAIVAGARLGEENVDATCGRTLHAVALFEPTGDPLRETVWRRVVEEGFWQGASALNQIFCLQRRALV